MSDNNNDKQEEDEMIPFFSIASRDNLASKICPTDGKIHRQIKPNASTVCSFLFSSLLVLGI
jgi:hypothetical protein